MYCSDSPVIHRLHHRSVGDDRGDTDDQVPDALVNVVLSFNQHFTGQWMVSPPAGVVVFTRSNYKHKTLLLPVCVEHITQEICLLVRLFSRMHTTAGNRSAPGVQGLLLASAVSQLLVGLT